MQAEGWWAWSTAAWLSLLSIPLALWPRFLLFMATPPSHAEHRDTLTPLESFMLTQFGIMLFFLSLALVFSIPSPSPIPSPAHRPNAPPTHPLLVPVTIGLLMSSFIAYNTPMKRIGALGPFVATGNGLLGLFGAWVTVFGGGAHFSRTTGADKRTSAFIFGNKNAASKIKKQWKKERDEYKRSQASTSKRD